MVLNHKEISNSILKQIYLEGKPPWGFEIYKDFSKLSLSDNAKLSTIVSEVKKKYLHI